MAMRDEVVGTHNFVFNEKDSGNESLILSTKFIANGFRNGIYVNQQLTLNSYCNSASFNLMGSLLTPDILRKLANELESELTIAKTKT